MSRKAKILMISLALASLASVRCSGPSKQTKAEFAAVGQLANTCDIGMPPQPPHEMYDQEYACFGDYECDPELKLKIGEWIYNTVVWVKEAHECAVQTRGVVSDLIND